MYRKYGKRVLDVLCSFVALILLAPIFIVIAIMIKIDSKGPVFFLQERLGKNGKIFKIIKFRTMVVNAEHIGPGLRITGKDDQRITKLGNVLRKTSLDELPQLINVLVGDMSLVGPRPPVTYHPYRFEEYSETQKKRFMVRPGITGLAQIRYRNSATWEERIKVDIEYIDKITIKEDIKILVKTGLNVLKKDNVYATKNELNKVKTEEVLK